MIVLEKIKSISIGKSAAVLAIMSVIFYIAFKQILLPKFMNSSLAIKITKESYMDREYRDSILTQMYGSYVRKMAGRE